MKGSERERESGKKPDFEVPRPSADWNLSHLSTSVKALIEARLRCGLNSTTSPTHHAPCNSDALYSSLAFRLLAAVLSCRSVLLANKFWNNWQIFMKLGMKVMPPIYFLISYRQYYNLTYLLHGAGYYLKSWLSLSFSKTILSYGTRRFITVFTQARHWTLSWASWIQFAHRSLSP
jgi:hypothetical protein